MLPDDLQRLLRVIAEGKGKWDIRNIDYVYFSHPDTTEDMDLLGTLRELECEGLIEDCRSDGSDVGWRITALGRAALESTT
ncbi:MAG: hypothetical protein WBF71_14855 [Microthrixaceae bacterium]